TTLTISPAWGILPVYDPVIPEHTSTYSIGTKIGSVWLGFEYTNGNPDAFGAKVYDLGLGDFRLDTPHVKRFGPQISLPYQSQTYITVSGAIFPPPPGVGRPPPGGAPPPPPPARSWPAGSRSRSRRRSRPRRTSSLRRPAASLTPNTATPGKCRRRRRS